MIAILSSLEKALINTNNFDNIILLSMYLYDVIENLDIDDSNGTTSTLANDITTIVETITNNISKYNEVIATFAFSHFVNPHIHLIDCYATLLENCLTKNNCLKYKEKLENLLNNSNEHIKFYVFPLLIKIINSLDYTNEEKINYFLKFKGNREIDDFLVTKYIETKNYSKALDICKAHPNCIEFIDYTIEIAKSKKDNNLMHDALRNKVIKTEELEDYLNLISLYNKDEEFNYMIKNCKPYFIRQIYAYEHNYEALMQSIINSKNELEYHKYSQLLKDIYFKEYIGFYKDIIFNKLSIANNRKHYRDIANTTKYLSTFNNSNNSINEILNHIKSNYKNKSALLDEFSYLFDKYL